MKATGIVRRIDELGRVVIPKEIRRTMRLREGEELEIYAQDEGLYLKKYSAVASLRDCADDAAQAVVHSIGGTCWVVDNDRVLGAAGAGGKSLIGAPLSVEMENLIGLRKTVVLQGMEVVPVVTDAPRCAALTVDPIVKGGDLYGAVVYAPAESVVDDKHRAVVCCARQMLENQLD